MKNRLLRQRIIACVHSISALKLLVLTKEKLSVALFYGLSEALFCGF